MTTLADGHGFCPRTVWGDDAMPYSRHATIMPMALADVQVSVYYSSQVWEQLVASSCGSADGPVVFVDSNGNTNKHGSRPFWVGRLWWLMPSTSEAMTTMGKSKCVYMIMQT